MKCQIKGDGLMRILWLGSSSVASLALMSSAAMAQTAPHAPVNQPDTPGVGPGASAAPAEEIIVTGSRIARQDYVAQSPIVTTSKAMIENAGVATVDAALLQLPQFQPGAGGFTNVSSGGLGVGQATLNLRGLGAVRTLVLLDGRRLEPGNAQSVIDINTIPTSAIANVEVITGGASATYGSDAIAGVVNFKIRRHFQGLEVSGQLGISNLGDAPTHQASFITGRSFAGGAGSIMVAGEYQDRKAIGFRDRAFSSPTGNLAALLGNGYYAPTASNMPTQTAVNAVFGRYGIADGAVPRSANFGINGDATLFRSGTPGTNYRSSGDACVVNSGAAGFGYDGQCTNNLQNALRRYAGLARADYEVADNTNVFLQGIYAHSLAYGQGSHPQATPFGAAGLTVPITNPFIPADLRQLLASRPNPTDSFIFQKRVTQNGPRSFTSATDTYQIVGGIEGKVADSGWSYELYGSHGQTRALDKSFGGSISISAVQRLLAAPDGGASLCSGGYNIFGPNPTSASCAAYIQRNTETRTRIQQDEASLNVTGGLFHLPAGEVKVNVGGIYRRNTYRVTPDSGLQAGDIAALVAVQPTTGKIRVAEGAIELLVPLLRDLPLVKSLNLTGGYRYSYYWPAGSISTYKASFDWRVGAPLLLRGGYQKAVRAPNIGELYQPASGVIANTGLPPSAGDPCDVRNNLRLGASASSVRSLCIAQGVPASIVDTYNQANVAMPSVTQGNLALKPETAKSYTIGAVIQPVMLGGIFRRMSFSIDYYNIRITDVIATLAVQTSLNKCFNTDGSNPSYSQSNFFCSLITRSPVNGAVSQAVQPLFNQGAYRTDGIDAQFDWALPAEIIGLSPRFGVLNINMTANYLRSFKIQTLPGTPFQEYAGTIGGDVYPRWKLSGSAIYDVNKVQIGLRWRHLSAFRDSSVVTNPASTVPGPDATDYFDLIGRLRVSDRFELRGGITNLTDKTPPQVGSLQGFTNSGVYDVIGRAYYVGAKVRF